MRKTIAAVTLGLLLVAGQAVASNNAAARVGDRVGARAGDTSEFQAQGIPAAVWIVGGIVAVAAVSAATSDNNASDN